MTNTVKQVNFASAQEPIQAVQAPLTFLNLAADERKP
jgi:hypothetical protein